MQPILSAAQMRAIDQETATRGVPVLQLMERAGHAVARAALALTEGAYGRRAVVACGKGNNGGDGLVAARYLAQWGMRVVVFLLVDDPSSELDGAGLTNFHRLPEAGASWRRFDEAALERELARADVAVDAVFGTGFRGTAEGPHRAALEALGAGGVPVVAVDIPSGVEGDTAAVRGPSVRATVTVTFGAPKAGHVFLPGSIHAGLIEVVDIGFPADLVRSDLLLVEPEDVRERLPVREPDAHKRRSGVVVVLAGSRRMTGAPRLVARGAARAGAGLVQVAVPDGILPIVQAGQVESTFVGLAEEEGSAAAGAWDALAKVLEGADAVAVGPGLSTDGSAPELVRRLAGESPTPMVLDADALNAFVGHLPDLSTRAADAVLTPHTGEFARLFGMPAEEVLEDRVGLARKAAAETGAVVLLKGPRTLVALPEGEVRVIPSGTAALSTGGTGDVLTGMIAAYLGRGLGAADAATVGAYVHGVAGEVAGEAGGDGTVAWDVAEAVPEAVRRLREAG